MSARDFIRANSTGDILYGCRIYGPEYEGLRGAQVLNCERCAQRVIATPSVLADRRRVAHGLNRTLVVVCDDCLLAQANDGDRPVVLELPDADDMEAAQKMREA